MGVSLPIRAEPKRRRRCALPRALQNTIVLPTPCVGEGWSLSRCDRQAPRPAVQRSHVRTPLRSRQDFSGHIAGHIGEAIGVSVVEAGQSLVIHAEQMEQGGDRVRSHDPFRLCCRGDVQLPGKMPGLAVEEVDLQTSAPAFQTRSEPGVPHRYRR
jgi:hypothetical protein